MFGRTCSNLTSFFDKKMLKYFNDFQNFRFMTKVKLNDGN